MSDTEVITISFPKGLRTGGDIISGVVDLDLNQARQKEVESLTISLCGELRTLVTQARRNYITLTHRYREWLFPEIKTVLWAGGATLPPPHSPGIIRFPFSFTIPTTVLPSSFYCGSDRSGASIQYYVLAHAARKSVLQRDIRVARPFPFVPLDKTTAPNYDFSSWTGEWMSISTSEKMRRGVVNQHGLTTIEVQLPKVDSFPLFQPIPIRMRIVCKSRRLSGSSAKNPNSFDFPRVPINADIIEMTIHQVSDLSVRDTHKMRFESDFGIKGGILNLNADEEKSPKSWSTQVPKGYQRSVVPPYWTVCEKNQKEGYWTEEATFSTTIVFRCPLPFQSQCLKAAVYLNYKLDFPGLGNIIKNQIGPLPLSSGETKVGNGLRTALDSRPSSPVEKAPSKNELELPSLYYQVEYLKEGEANTFHVDPKE